MSTPETNPILEAAAKTSATKKRKKDAEQQRKNAEQRCHEKTEAVLDLLAELIEETSGQEELLDQLLAALRRKKAGQPLIGERMVDDELNENNRVSPADVGKLAELARRLGQPGGYQLAFTPQGRVDVRHLDENGNPIPSRRPRPTPAPAPAPPPSESETSDEEEVLVTQEGEPSDAMERRFNAAIEEIGQGDVTPERLYELRTSLHEVRDEALEQAKELPGEELQHKADRDIRYWSHQRMTDFGQAAEEAGIPQTVVASPTQPSGGPRTRSSER